ncbi:MAG TPA: T9SS type A sorting domain-containing protein [Patescibacteria group bacterium]|nr:T9SS type A sorting domain-containing protein [Patescibacteria group bacterium]
MTSPLKTFIAVLFIAVSFKAEAQGVFGESWYRGGFGPYVGSVAVSPDGEVVALLTETTIELRDAFTGKLLKEPMRINEDGFNRGLQLLWSKKDNFLIVIEEEKTVFIDTATGKVFKELPYSSSYQYNTYSKLHKFSPSGKYLLIDTNVFIETETWTKINFQVESSEYITLLPGDSTALIMPSYSKLPIRLIRFPSGEVLKSYTNPYVENERYTITTNNTGAMFALMDRVKVVIADIATGDVVQQIEDGHKIGIPIYPFADIIFSPDDKSLLIGNKLLWNITDSSFRYLFLSAGMRIGISPDWSKFYGRHAVGGQYMCNTDVMPTSYYSFMCLTDQDKILWRSPEGHRLNIRSIGFKSDTLLTISRDSTQISWDSEGNLIEMKSLAVLPDADSSYDVSPHGKYRIERDGYVEVTAASGDYEGWQVLKIYDNVNNSLVSVVKDVVEQVPYYRPVLTAWAWMPNEEFLVTASKPVPDYTNRYESKTIKMWDVKTGKMTASITTPCYPTLIKVSSDGKSIALATEEFGVMHIKTIGDFATSILKEDAAGLSLNFFPNPLKESSTITCSLPADGVLKITLHDMLGREVAIVHDAFKSSGTHTFPFKGENVPNGLYFLKMSLGGMYVSRSVSVVR